MMRPLSLACLTGAKTSSERFITNCRARLNAPTVWFRALDQTDVWLSWMIPSTYLWPFNLSHKSTRPYDPLYCLITDQSFSSCWWDAQYSNPLCMNTSVVGWGQLICIIFENLLAPITIERVLNSYLDATGNYVVKIIFSASCYTKFILLIKIVYKTPDFSSVYFAHSWKKTGYLIYLDFTNLQGTFCIIILTLICKMLH